MFGALSPRYGHAAATGAPIDGRFVVETVAFAELVGARAIWRVLGMWQRFAAYAISVEKMLFRHLIATLNVVNVRFGQV